VGTEGETEYFPYLGNQSTGCRFFNSGPDSLTSIMPGKEQILVRAGTLASL
jgi:hypothetical protein